ncbi:MAG: hypothetical protein P1V51_19630 [Deltaproteobacteria bacterium]|nr:hypothetical protein [Deltaproteobacteria bacterium]
MRSAMTPDHYHKGLTEARSTVVLIGLCLGLGISCVTGPPVYESPRRGSIPLALEAEAAAPTPPGEGPVLAVQTLVDARPDFHREALPSWLAEQGGFTGEAPTRESAWAGDLAALATDDLVERLRRSGRFARVVRVEVVGAVPEGALLLKGRLRRLRGFQGYHVKKGQAPELVVSLGSAYLDEVELGDPRSRQLYFLGQAGARIDAADRLDPFALARAAWARAANSLVERIVAADLERPLQREVGLDPGARGELVALVEGLPGRWRLDESAPADRPPGWTGAGDCGSVALEDPSRTFYQPQLGHYRPRLRLWICPPQVQLALRLSEDGPRFPAELIGSLKGAPVLLLALGKSSWPGARAEILRFLGAEPLAGPILRWPMGEAPAEEALPEEPELPAGDPPALRTPISPVPPSGGAAPAP